MRNINALRNIAKTQRGANKPPTITGGETQIDLALDAAAASGKYKALLPGRIPQGLKNGYLAEGYTIVETLEGTTIYFQSEEEEED